MQNVDEVFVCINMRECLHFHLSCIETQTWDFFFLLNRWSYVSKSCSSNSSADWWYTDHTAYVYTEYRKSNTAPIATVQASPYVAVCTNHLQATVLPSAARQYPPSQVKGLLCIKKKWHWTMILSTLTRANSCEAVLWPRLLDEEI